MIMTTIVLVAGFSAVLASDSRDHRDFAALGNVTRGNARLCDIFCLPALVAVFDKPPKPPGDPRPPRSTG
jgi:predicted RND superfamily exporter protein